MSRKITQVWTEEELIDYICETLKHSNGFYLKDVAEKVLSEEVEYRGDGLYNITEREHIAP